jgi:hypothetical protein
VVIWVIRVAIVDDENFICSQIEQYLLQIEEELNIYFDIDVLYSGKELCKQLKQNILKSGDEKNEKSFFIININWVACCTNVC